MSLQKLESLLPKQIKELHTQAQIDGAQVCRLWHEYASQFFLNNTMEKHEAINFRDGILTILVSSPEVTEEIRAQQHKIVSRLNRTLGKNLVQSLRFRS